MPGGATQKTKAITVTVQAVVEQVASKELDRLVEVQPNITQETCGA